MSSKLYISLAPLRAYWRTASFAEIAQLYTSRFLRLVAQNLIGAFVAVFLYQNGYSLSLILLMVGVYYVVRVLFCYLSAYVVGFAGPKRSMLLSSVLAVPALVALSMIELYTIWAVAVYFLFEAGALSLLAVASDTHFSSIKSDHKAGKEIGSLYMLEKIGTGLAPFVGGLLAYRFGPQAVMWVSALLMVAAALPLFGTPERVRRRQKVLFRGLPWKKIRREYAVMFAQGGDQAATATLWPLFIALAILGTGDNKIYAELGAFFSLSFIASMVVSRLYGTLIDKRKGRQLYRTGVVSDALVHLVRPFITTPLGIGMTNVANEVATIACTMPFVRDRYARADNLPGYRTAYFSAAMVSFCAGAACMSFLGAGLTLILGDIFALQVTFIVMALLCVGMFLHTPATLRSGD